MSEVAARQDSQVVLESVVFSSSEGPVLRSISHSFPPGATSAIMGPAGSGKSTLLKCAAGLLDPDEGTVRLFGRDLSAIGERKLMPLRRRCGFVFQDAALWQNMTVAQNLLLPLQVHEPHMAKGDMADRVESLVRRVGLRTPTTKRPSDMSQGERKVVSFLRSLVLEPEVLFLDEPTGHVDVESRERMLAMLKELKRQGRTLILVTHDPEMTAQLADYILVVHGGKTLESGPVDRVVRSPDPRVAAVLTDVLSKTSVYDADILDILDESQEFGGGP